MSAITIVAGSLTAYVGVLTVVGARRPPPRRHASNPLTFTILVPAHNEESSIGATLDAMRAIRHSRFSVHVVADNCTDRTAEVVRARGFHVHERDDAALPGKGPALNWLFDRLDADEECPFDVAVVVDADTIVDPEFLAEMESAFENDVAVVQGHYGVLHPESSPAIGLRAAGLAARHHLRPLGRVRIGGSSGLFGNGMAFRRDVLRRHRWTGHLVEDAQLQVELLTEGTRVMYAPRARVMAEMPDSLERSESQNRRWEAGRLQIVNAYGPLLARRSMSGPFRTRVAVVDELLDLLVPPIAVLGACHVALAGTSAIGALFGSRSQRAIVALNAAGALILVTHVLVALRTVGAPPTVYRSLLGMPRYAVWKLRTWFRALLRPDAVQWTRTARNSERAD